MSWSILILVWCYYGIKSMIHCDPRSRICWCNLDLSLLKFKFDFTNWIHHANWVTICSFVYFFPLAVAEYLWLSHMISNMFLVMVPCFNCFWHWFDMAWMSSLSVGNWIKTFLWIWALSKRLVYEFYDLSHAFSCLYFFFQKKAFIFATKYGWLIP